jgi:hypothetical protein
MHRWRTPREASNPSESPSMPPADEVYDDDNRHFILRSPLGLWRWHRQESQLVRTDQGGAVKIYELYAHQNNLFGAIAKAARLEYDIVRHMEPTE